MKNRNNKKKNVNHLHFKEESRIDFRFRRTLSTGGAISHHPSLTRAVVMPYLSPSSRWSRRLPLQSTGEYACMGMVNH